MKEFNAETHPMVKTAGVSVGKIDYNNRDYPAYIGLDVRKETIAWR